MNEHQRQLFLLIGFMFLLVSVVLFVFVYSPGSSGSSGFVFPNVALPGFLDIMYEAVVGMVKLIIEGFALFL